MLITRLTMLNPKTAHAECVGFTWKLNLQIQKKIRPIAMDKTIIIQKIKNRSPITFTKYKASDNSGSDNKNRAIIVSTTLTSTPFFIL